MKIEKFEHKGVGPDGKVESGGAVLTKPFIRMSIGEGCGLNGCHCSDGYWISIGLARTKDGVVEGVIVRFDSAKEIKTFLETHEVIGK